MINWIQRQRPLQVCDDTQQLLNLDDRPLCSEVLFSGRWIQQPEHGQAKYGEERERWYSGHPHCSLHGAKWCLHAAATSPVTVPHNVYSYKWKKPSHEEPSPTFTLGPIADSYLFSGLMCYGNCKVTCITELTDFHGLNYIFMNHTILNLWWIPGIINHSLD